MKAELLSLRVKDYLTAIVDLLHQKGISCSVSHIDTCNKIHIPIMPTLKVDSFNETGTISSIDNIKEYVITPTIVKVSTYKSSIVANGINPLWEDIKNRLHKAPISLVDIDEARLFITDIRLDEAANYFGYVFSFGIACIIPEFIMRNKVCTGCPKRLRCELIPECNVGCFLDYYESK